ncbi:MAG: hypothetical protein ACREBE_15310, partial [bacterium]
PVVQRVTLYGIAPEQLRRLLPRDLFGDAVDDCLGRVRSSYVSIDADAARRAWQFDLEHRGRFHAGSIPWHLSLARWPVMAALDRELLALCASLPEATLVKRRAQDELLRTRFPALARLPLDRGSHDMTPLLPPASWRLRQLFAKGVPSSRNREKIERRRYHRLFDINAPRWRAMRQLAEPGRRRAAEVLDAVVLDELLPPPDANVEPPYPIAGSNGLKSLLGFFVWLMEYG